MLGLPPTSTGEGGDPFPGVGGLRAGTLFPSQLHMQREGLHATETDAETHLEAGVRGPSSTHPPTHGRPHRFSGLRDGQGHELVSSNVRATLAFGEQEQVLS